MIWISMAASAADLVEIQYDHSLRVERRHLKVTVDSLGQVDLETDPRRAEVEKISKISAREVSELSGLLDSIDWESVARDKVIGLDGASVRILYQGKEFRLWSPGVQTEKRGLLKIRKLIGKVFATAGLDEYGLPQTDHR